MLNGKKKSKMVKRQVPDSLEQNLLSLIEKATACAESVSEAQSQQSGAAARRSQAAQVATRLRNSQKTSCSSSCSPTK